MNNGIQFKRLVLKNFLSFGPRPTTIDLSGNHITVVLGLNHDTGGDESRNGVGKAQPLHSKILTPYGWSTMGEMKVGDPVITQSGSTALVTHVHPQGNQQTYKIHFKDGRVVECDENHLWKVWHRSSGWKYGVMSTLDLITHQSKMKTAASSRIYVPLYQGNSDVHDVALPIDPYIVGALLGDGSTLRSVRMTSADQHIIDRIESRLPIGMSVYKENSKYSYGISDGVKGSINRIKSGLSTVDMWGHRSWEKRISGPYKTMSYRQTIQLLQGLLDTDGTIDGCGGINLITTSHQLANDTQELVHSIGGIATITHSDKKRTHHPDGSITQGRRAYRVGIRHPDRQSLFSLPRKRDKLTDEYQYADTLRLEIVKIEQHTIQPTQCITISSTDSLYITDGYVVTHNSALIDSISYALFGKTVRGISNQKLVNKMARKGQGMLIVLELDTPTGSYRIERGEAPSKLKLFRKDLDNTDDFLARDGKTFIYDVSRNKNETTTEIEGLLGFDIKLFEFLIANTSESDAFMKLTEEKKREIAERLMGLNLLTERAEELKDERKDKKRTLISQESALEATQQANARIERQLSELVAKEEGWKETRDKDIDIIRDQIESLSKVDVDEQIEILKLIEELEIENTRVQSDRRAVVLELRQANRDLKDIQDKINASETRSKELDRQKVKLDESVCPTCNQHWVADPSIIEQVQTEINEISVFSEESVNLVEVAEEAIAVVDNKNVIIDEEEQEIEKVAESISDIDLVFETTHAAVESGAELSAKKNRLVELEADTVNPHTDTIKGLQSDALKTVDDSELRELRKLIEHYTYLIDLLQNKDSFLRKAVIDRWLPQLNGRIHHYLEILELPYTVRIENDLTMTIRDFGEDFDWGNLSKGQRQRVTIALNLAFQDLFEATNQPLSLLMVDELIDSGICNRGAGLAVQALRDACESKNKRVFLITHRTDIADQIEDVMLVEMKNRISRIEEDEDDGN